MRREREEKPQGHSWGPAPQEAGSSPEDPSSRGPPCTRELWGEAAVRGTALLTRTQEHPEGPREAAPHPRRGGAGGGGTLTICLSPPPPLGATEELTTPHRKSSSSREGVLGIRTHQSPCHHSPLSHPVLRVALSGRCVSCSRETTPGEPAPASASPREARVQPHLLKRLTFHH